MPLDDTRSERSGSYACVYASTSYSALCPPHSSRRKIPRRHYRVKWLNNRAENASLFRRSAPQPRPKGKIGKKMQRLRDVAGLMQSVKAWAAEFHHIIGRAYHADSVEYKWVACIQFTSIRRRGMCNAWRSSCQIMCGCVCGPHQLSVWRAGMYSHFNSVALRW